MIYEYRFIYDTYHYSEWTPVKLTERYIKKIKGYKELKIIEHGKRDNDNS